jgi:hypothetical protein
MKPDEASGLSDLKKEKESARFQDSTATKRGCYIKVRVAA